MNPRGAPRLCVEGANPANRYCSYGEWEGAEGDCAEVIRDESIICLPPEAVAHARRIRASFRWRQEAPDNANPAAPENAQDRPYLFTDRISLVSKTREGFRASIMARPTGRSSGARRRESEQPKL